MKVQFYAGHAARLAMRWGEPLRLERSAGEVIVKSGRVWLTREGDADDHVLEAGQRVCLDAGGAVVLEPWQRDEHTVIDWRPRAQPRLDAFVRGAAAFGLRGVAGAADFTADALRRAAGGLAALARSAAAMARRAQGAICAGESIASAGALQ